MPTSYANITFRDDDGLFDPTSVVLSDPDGDYGVKLNSDDSVIVADYSVTAVAMTKLATGRYQQAFTSTAGAEYTAYVEVVIGGESYWIPRIITATPAVSTVAGAGQTFSDIYTDVGEYLYATRSLSADQKVVAKRLTNSGYRDLLGSADWSCLHPAATLGIWPTVTATVTISTVTLTYTPTVAVPSIFLPSMVGHTVVFTVTGTSYTISSVTSSTVAVLTASAADEGATAAFTITADGNYTLPSDFLYLEAGPLLHAPDVGLAPLWAAGVGDILARRASSTAGGEAMRYGVRPLEFTTTQGQLFEIMLWPTPGTARTLHVQYRSEPAAMTSDDEYPVGGRTLGLAIRAFGLKAAEWLKTQTYGPMAKEADVQLAKALRVDGRQRSSAPIPITDGPQGGPPRTPVDWTEGITIS